MTKEQLQQINLPKHIGIIMDGNGRWATQRGLERSEGHRAGADAFRKICEYGADIGLECMTFYAFSTENWKRPAKEISAIMELFRDYLEEARDREKENERRGLKFHFLGNKKGLPKDIVLMLDALEKRTADKKVMTVNLAINYGGRDEILHSVKEIAKKVKKGKLEIDDITQDVIGNNLYTKGQPDPDLIIRPSGEYRLSNFMIWQAAYSEFWFSDILWPDFTTDDLDKAIADYSARNRRFGGV